MWRSCVVVLIIACICIFVKRRSYRSPYVCYLCITALPIYTMSDIKRKEQNLEIHNTSFLNIQKYVPVWYLCHFVFFKFIPRYIVFPSRKTLLHFTKNSLAWAWLYFMETVLIIEGSMTWYDEDISIKHVYDLTTKYSLSIYFHNYSII